MRDAKEDRLERLIGDRMPIDRVGQYADPAMPRRRVQIVERGVHQVTGVEYLRIRDGESGGGLWYRMSEVRLLHPDDV